METGEAPGPSRPRSGGSDCSNELPLLRVKREEDEEEEETPFGEERKQQAGVDSRIIALKERLVQSEKRAKQAEEDRQIVQDKMLTWIDNSSESDRRRVKAEQQLLKERQDAAKKIAALQRCEPEQVKEWREKYEAECAKCEGLAAKAEAAAAAAAAAALRPVKVEKEDSKPTPQQLNPAAGDAAAAADAAANERLAAAEEKLREAAESLKESAGIITGLQEALKEEKARHAETEERRKKIWSDRESLEKHLKRVELDLREERKKEERRGGRRDGSRERREREAEERRGMLRTIDEGKRAFVLLEQERDGLIRTMGIANGRTAHLSNENTDLQQINAQLESANKSMQAKLADIERREKAWRESEEERWSKREHKLMEAEVERANSLADRHREREEQRQAELRKMETEVEELTRVNAFLVTTKTGEIAEELKQARKRIQELESQLKSAEAGGSREGEEADEDGRRKRARVEEEPAPAPFVLQAFAAVAPPPPPAASKWKPATGAAPAAAAAAAAPAAAAKKAPAAVFKMPAVPQEPGKSFSMNLKKKNSNHLKRYF